MPNWGVSLVLFILAAWKIPKSLRYRDHKFFLKEVGGEWLDKSRVDSAVKTYILLEVSMFLFLPIFTLTTYFQSLHPYLWHIALAFLGGWFCLAISWFVIFKDRSKRRMG